MYFEVAAAHCFIKHRAVFGPYRRTRAEGKCKRHHDPGSNQFPYGLL